MVTKKKIRHAAESTIRVIVARDRKLDARITNLEHRIEALEQAQDPRSSAATRENDDA